MRYLIIFLLIGLVSASCSDAKRLQRISQRHPEWLRDTSVTGTVTPPPIVIHDSFAFAYSPAINYDSLINEVADSMGFMKKEDCKKIAEKTYIKKVVVFPDDTFLVHGDQYYGSAWFSGNQLMLDLDVAPDKITVTLPCPPVITPPPPISWWQKGLQWIGGISLILLLAIFALGYFTGKRPRFL